MHNVHPVLARRRSYNRATKARKKPITPKAQPERQRKHPILIIPESYRRRARALPEWAVEDWD